MKIASIVIPNKNRTWQLERAIDSVIAQNGAQHVEIIVIDDASEFDCRPKNLRAQDSFIEIKESKGAAFCRNIGISASEGEMIYLLDSDDTFIARDFIQDNKRYSSTKNLYYTDLIVDNKKTSFPNEIKKQSYLQYVFCRQKYIGQTSTLFFPRIALIFFDDTLPKHQDWDLALTFLTVGSGRMLKAEGLSCFDREDKASISRSFDPNKSLPWLKKLNSSETKQDYSYAHFYLRSSNTADYPLLSWLANSARYLFSRKLTTIDIAKSFIRRYLI